MKESRVDIETFSGADLPKVGVFRYVEDPQFAILMASWRCPDTGELRTLDYMRPDPALEVELLTMLTNPAVRKFAWNAGFELHCFRAYYPEVDFPADQWECEMVRAQMLGLPAKLSEAALALKLPVEQQKSTSGRSLIAYFCGPCKPTKKNGGRTRNLPEHDPEKWALFLEYNRQDVRTEEGVSVVMAGIGETGFAVQHAFWSDIDLDLNARGICVDLDLVDGAIALSEAHQATCLQRAIELTGLANPNSLTQLKKWLLGETGEIVDSLNKANIPEYIKSAPTAVVAEVLALRQQLSLSSIKKYHAVRRSVCADGRIRGVHQFYGANRTGRYSGRLVQMQNLKKNPPGFDIARARELVKARRADDIEFLWGNLPLVLSECIRAVFVPPPGAKLLDADYSAVEARVLAWAAWQVWRVELFHTGGKIYEASASKMFGIPLAEITKAHPARQKGKVAELALGYQGAVDAMIRMGALKMGLKEEELLPIVKAWRAANKAIVDFWYTMERAAIAATQTGKPQSVDLGDPEDPACLTFSKQSNGRYTWLVMTLPSGRSLYYFDPKLEKGVRYGKPVTKLTYMGNGDTGKWMRIPTYGGKLTENFVQAFARDLLTDAMQRATVAGMLVDFHVHDEVCIEVTKADAEAQQGQLEGLMAVTPAWAPGLPLTADGELLDFYHKTED